MAVWNLVDIERELKKHRKRIAYLFSQLGVSGSSLFPTTGTGTATGNVIGDLNGLNLQVVSGVSQFFGIETLLDNENVYLVAQNGTNLDNYGVFQANATPTDSSVQIRANNYTDDGNFGMVNLTSDNLSGDVQIRADFNDGVKYAEILMNADTVDSLIQMTADVYQFTGVQEFADNAAAILGGLPANAIYRTGDTLKIVH